jgi:SAM-dependent methyltransferase
VAGDYYAAQESSGGTSNDEILEAGLTAAEPRPGLSWIDVGCGTGDLLRMIRDGCEPASLTGIDLIPWLASDLSDDVEFRQGAAEDIDDLAPADRVMLIEVIEHLEAPWRTLRRAARLVRPGGRIVVSTPNVATLRHRIDLSVRGRLTSFRPDNEAHISPALPHVIARVLSEEGLTPDEPRYAAADVIPLAHGRLWPQSLRERRPALLSVSVVIGARRAGETN